MSFTEEKTPEIQSALPAPRLAALEALSVRAGEPWFTHNQLPLFVLGLGIVALLMAMPLRMAIHKSAKPERPESTVRAPVLDEIPEEKLIQQPAILARTFLTFGSALFCLSLAAACAFSANYRRRVAEFIKPASARVLPAVRGLDVGAAISINMGAGALLAFLLVPSSGQLPGEYTAWMFICGSAGMLCAITAVILLAKARAGGWHGAAGLVPFWTQSKLAKPRTIWNDIGLAITVYAIANGPLILGGALNKGIVKWAGWKSDQHSLIGDLLIPQPTWVLVVFVFAGTVGAAFTEELLFRGGLYNACRRYMGAILAAILAGLIFSAVHFIRSDFIPLFMLGLIMTWLYERTGRLVASMVFHFINNALSILTVLSLKDHI